MNPSEIPAQLAEIRTILETHTDLLGILTGQCVTHTARLETILSVLREILAKHGVDKETSKRICGEIFAQCVPVAQSEIEQAIRSADKRHLPPSSGPEVERN